MSKLLGSLAGYNNILLRHSPILKNTAMMVGTLVLLQLLLVFLLSLTALRFFFNNWVYITAIALTFSFIWYYCIRVAIISLQENHSFLTFLRISILIFLASIFLSTVALVCAAAETLEQTESLELEISERTMIVVNHAFCVYDSIQILSFKILFYLGVGIFILLPSWMLYLNNKSSYYELVKTYNLFKANEIL